MKLDFTDRHYFDIAMSLAGEKSEEGFISREDALLVIINGLKPEQLDNLYNMLKHEHIDYSDLTRLSDEEKKCVYKCAMKLIDSGMTLGTETINDGKINTSAWISHSLWEGRLCAILAEAMNLDSERAEVMGMLHDYGRKEVHSIEHVIRGFELLSDMGYSREGLGCLTHSFINGGRCASNETAEDGFYVSPEGLPCWSENADKDDVTLFLEKYVYDDYDRILNLADLMAASSGILSPYDRILDIMTRRKIDETNRGYFLAELIGLIAYISEAMKLECCPADYIAIRFDEGKRIDEMMGILKEISAGFYRSVMAI